MAVVVDASVIGAIVFGEPDADTLRVHLQRQTLIAPALIDFELANLTVKKMRRHPELAATALALLGVALRTPITRVQIASVEVAALAAQTGLTAYDASYLWLARSRDAELVTLDAELAGWISG
jgi:predicted nucleic acid-binding protein